MGIWKQSRRLNRLGGAFLLVVLLIVGALPVLAWHPAISAKYVCLPDGTYQVSGHASPWETENLADRVNESIVVTRGTYGGEVVASGAFAMVDGEVPGFDWTDDQVFYPGNVAQEVVYVVSARAPWVSNGEPARVPGNLHPDQTVLVELPGTCVPDEEAQGTIIVKKVTNIVTDQEFGFTASWDQDGFTLSNGGTETSGLLDSGTYSVSESTPEGWTSRVVCSDGSPAGAISLQPGEEITCTFTNTKDTQPPLLTVSPTPTPTGAIGDWVWEDTNGDGHQADTESGVPGVQVNLLDGTGASKATTRTDSSGYYLFSGLPAGSYEVQFVVPDDYRVSPLRAAGPSVDSDAGTNGKTGLITLAAGQTDLTWDAGLVPIRPTLVLPQVITASTTTSTTIAATSETLPFTGIGDSLVGGVAVALLALGGLVLLAIRRREQVVVADDWYSRLSLYTLKY